MTVNTAKIKKKRAANYARNFSFVPPLSAALTLFLALTVDGAHAAQPSAIPSAGSLLQQANPVAPSAPAGEKPHLLIEQGSGTVLPSSPPFPIKLIQITGNTVFDTSTLHALVAAAEGNEITLPQLKELAGRISAYYHAHGYPLAQAIVPAQTIRDNTVQIEIIEARYGKIRLDNHSRTNDSLLSATLSPLQGGQEIEQESLNRSLLKLSDVPGVTVNAILKPGEAVGNSDLLVTAQPAPAFTGGASLNNYGDQFTGRTRIAGTLNVIAPLHHGDIFSLDVLGSGRGMEYGQLRYETLLNGYGTRTGASYSALHYTLGDTLASLDAHGTAQTESIWLKHPLIRSQKTNLYGQIQYEHQQLRDTIGASDIQMDRHLNNWMLDLNGDLRDSLLGDAVNTWNLGITSGQVGFDNAAAQSADAAAANTQGRFSKWSGNFSRLQTLGYDNSLYFAISGQWSDANLDPSEKMTAGGPYTVRAYDIGALSGDSGVLGSAEWRHNLGQAWKGQWQTVLFVDSEHVTVNRNVWTPGPNDATLSGAGIGLDWLGIEQWSARIYLAAPLGSTPALVGTNNSVRAWAEIRKGF